MLENLRQSDAGRSRRLASCALASLPLLCGQIEPLRQNGYALKHTTPEHKAGEIGLKAVKQNEHALKHAAPEHKEAKAVSRECTEARRTQAGLRGGVVPEGRPQDFSTRRLSRQYARPHLTSRETHWASREAVAYWDWA